MKHAKSILFAVEDRRGDGQNRRGDGQNRRRNIRGRGRPAALVGDYGYRVTFAAEAQHGGEEIILLATEDPRGAHDHRPVPLFADSHFSGGFRPAIDADRRDRIVLAIRAGFLAVEHIIGGQVNQRTPGLGAAFGNDRGAIAIDREGCLGFALRLIDRGIGGGINDQIGRDLANRRFD